MTLTSYQIPGGGTTYVTPLGHVVRTHGGWSHVTAYWEEVAAGGWILPSWVTSIEATLHKGRIVDAVAHGDTEGMESPPPRDDLRRFLLLAFQAAGFAMALDPEDDDNGQLDLFSQSEDE